MLHFRSGLGLSGGGGNRVVVPKELLLFYCAKPDFCFSTEPVKPGWTLWHSQISGTVQSPVVLSATMPPLSHPAPNSDSHTH